MKNNCLIKFDVPNGYTSETYLEKIVKSNIKKRLGENVSDYVKKRIDYELSVINKLNYTDCFLAVWDIVNYAKTNNIPTGAGRGSIGGSLAAYVSGITEVNPLDYNLLFKRFLNPEKPVSPAVVIDVCRKNLSEIISYAEQKYGKDNIKKENGIYYLYDIGLLPFETLTSTDRILKSVERNYKIKLDINNIPVDDKETFDMLSNGETKGVFFLNDEGATKITKIIKPQSIEDLSSIIALFRPQIIGTGLLDEFIENKLIFPYIQKSINPILQNTYGTIIYQEQIMQLLQEYTGCSLNEADIIRRAMSKKDNNVTKKEKLKFINKAAKNNIPKDEAGKIFDNLAEQAQYSFNKAHSISYALIIYQTAYLKCRYNKEFNEGIINE